MNKSATSLINFYLGHPHPSCNISKKILTEALQNISPERFINAIDYGKVRGNPLNLQGLSQFLHDHDLNVEPEELTICGGVSQG